MGGVVVFVSADIWGHVSAVLLVWGTALRGTTELVQPSTSKE